MRSEKSCGAIVFRIEQDRPVYLLLFGPTYWGFVKGLVEKGESEEETALREAEEETGMKVKLLSGFKERINYNYKFDGEPIKKEVIFFIAEAPSAEVKLSQEHEDFKWLKFEEAFRLVKYRNQKEILKRAHEFVLKALQQKRLAWVW